MGTEQGNYFQYRNISFVEFKNSIDFDGLSHSACVLNQNKGDYVFIETVDITGSAIAILFHDRNSSEARSFIRNRAIIKAKARLEAGNYLEDGSGRYSEKINPLSIKEQLQYTDEGIIQRLILNTLYNIRRMNPTNYKLDRFELEGFCALYNIRREQVEYVITLLDEKNYVGTKDIAAGEVYITAEGIGILKAEENPSQEDFSSTYNRNYDVFISHASEDKISVVEPLAKALKDDFCLRVWYDKWTLRIGDSLRQKIDEGLANSRYGVVVLSPSFFNKRWPQSELDGLFQREILGGTKVILPVIHEMTIDEVCKHSHLISGKLALDTAIGIQEIARQIAEVIHERNIGGEKESLIEVPSADKSFEEYLSLDFYYDKIDVSNDEVHRYSLIVKVRLNTPPTLNQFMLLIYWPEGIKIQDAKGFKRGNIVRMGDINCREFYLNYKNAIFPGQEISLIGLGNSYEIQYIIDDDTLDFIQRKNVKLKYVVFTDDYMPQEGEVEFKRLIYF